MRPRRSDTHRDQRELLKVPRRLPEAFQFGIAFFTVVSPPTGNPIPLFFPNRQCESLYKNSVCESETSSKSRENANTKREHKTRTQKNLSLSKTKTQNLRMAFLRLTHYTKQKKVFAFSISAFSEWFFSPSLKLRISILLSH